VCYTGSVLLFEGRDYRDNLISAVPGERQQAFQVRVWLVPVEVSVCRYEPTTDVEPKPMLVSGV
jgi:hypothetical protein